MKPKSLSVGNILVLAKCIYGVKQAGSTEWTYKENTNHKFLGIHRKIVAAKTKYVEIGEERSMLQYPKKDEYTEKDNSITITYKEDGGNNSVSTCAMLFYIVIPA